MVDGLLQQTNLWDVRKKARRDLLGRHETAVRHRAGAPRQSAPHHRRRADRGPRPGRAQSISQPARLDRPRRDRHSLHAHRRRRPRALFPHGDHRRRRGAARRLAQPNPSRASAAGCGRASCPATRRCRRCRRGIRWSAATSWAASTRSAYSPPTRRATDSPGSSPSSTTSTS